ncbi:MAG TPA: GlcNAc-PI de-N-acetylase, partial [Candidatus Avipropionibacterium avicola]|nr:GlcNAc-PI de-N-acetylase [Candidatus Avipropionibacterium avicola]
IGSNWFTVIHSRSPMVDPTTGDEAALRGAVLPIKDGLALGTLIDARPARFAVAAGDSLDLDVTVRAPEDAGLAAGSLTLRVPDGWDASQEVRVPALRAGQSHDLTVTVTPPVGADQGNVQVGLDLTVGKASGSTIAQIRVSGAVEATIEALPEIAEFRDWTSEVGMEHLNALVPELMAIGIGRTRDLQIEVTNHSGEPTAGQVAIEVPAGFEVEPAVVDFPAVDPDDRTQVTVQLSQTDPDMPAANRADNEGRWPVTITTTTESGTASREVTLNVVPTTTVPRIGDEAVTIDGQWSSQKYPGEELDVSALWDGEATTAEDVSGSAWISHDDEALYVFVHVVDDIRGTILPTEDNKRQRRTDSIEIYLDPRGDAPNTAHTFIAGIMPSMDSMTGAPGVGRDRDNWQGPADETAPGMEVAVVMADTEQDYAGYDVEARIPLEVLPDHIDPDRLGFNVVINDSDTQDKAAQTRTGWSTYPGMRADPWRWGLCTVPGLSDQASAPKEPQLPDTAAQSVESPQSILQSSDDGVPLGGWPALRRPVKVRSARLVDGEVRARVVTTVAGTLRAFVWDGEQIVGQVTTEPGKGSHEIAIEVEDTDGTAVEDWQLVVSLSSDDRVSSAVVAVG